jgi:hypothetical protein
MAKRSEARAMRGLAPSGRTIDFADWEVFPA